jgi:hypothetical protein
MYLFFRRNLQDRFQKSCTSRNTVEYRSCLPLISSYTINVNPQVIVFENSSYETQLFAGISIVFLALIIPTLENGELPSFLQNEFPISFTCLSLSRKLERISYVRSSTAFFVKFIYSYFSLLTLVSCLSIYISIYSFIYVYTCMCTYMNVCTHAYLYEYVGCVLYVYLRTTCYSRVPVNIHKLTFRVKLEIWEPETPEPL